MNSSSASRRDEIDLFRGIGIVLMVLGHVGFEGGYNTFIHAFHMPMFFIVSGILFDDKSDFGIFTVKRARTLLIPYLVFGLFHVAAAAFIRGWDSEYLTALFWRSTDIIPIGGAVWFFISMFFAQIITKSILMLKSTWMRIALFTVIGIGGQLVKSLTGVVLPYGISAAMVGSALIYIGYSGRRYYEKIKEMKLPLWLVITAAAVGCGTAEGYVDMRQEIYTVIPLFWIAAVLYSISILRISVFVQDRLPGFPAVKWLKSVGISSAVYLAFNEIVLSALKRFSPLLGLPLWIEYIAVITAAFVILYTASLIFNKTPLKKILGR